MTHLRRRKGARVLVSTTTAITTLLNDATTTIHDATIATKITETMVTGRMLKRKMRISTSNRRQMKEGTAVMNRQHFHIRGL